MTPPLTRPQRRRQEGLAHPWSVLGDTSPCPDPTLTPLAMMTHDINSSSDHGDFQPGWNPPPGHSSLVAKVCPAQ